MASKIIDITGKKEYEKYLYKCLAPMPYRKYKTRLEYLQCNIPKGFRKKILIWNKEVVGTIEYAPAGSSGLPIFGNGIYVINCIWVLRKAKGHNFGKVLINDTIQEIKNMNAKGLATISLENYPSPWLKKEQMEKLGFYAIDSLELKIIHKEKYKGTVFKIYLMWLPIEGKTKIPTWNKEELLKGVRFCLAHPLYHPESAKIEQIFGKV
jgi:hypothetical protein